MLSPPNLAKNDAVQEALIAAAAHWPYDGVPENPRGWLLQTATRRFIDQRRSEQSRRSVRPKVSPSADSVAERLNGPYRLDAVHAHLLELSGDTRAAQKHYRAAASRATNLAAQATRLGSSLSSST